MFNAFPVRVVTDNREITKAVTREGWAPKGYFPRLLFKIIGLSGKWLSIKIEANFYQHNAVESAIRRNARELQRKVQILHGENEIFVRLRT